MPATLDSLADIIAARAILIDDVWNGMNPHAPPSSQDTS